MPTPHTGRIIVMMSNRNATQAETDALAAKIDRLGAPQGFRTVDTFPGTLLVQGDEAFGEKIKQSFGAEIKRVAKETFVPLPNTRPKLRKPPAP